MSKTGPKKKTKAELRAEQSDCWCGNPDPNESVLCDAEEGCFKWYHYKCEGFTLFDLGDIKQFICKGCRAQGLGKMTYKGYNPAAELPDDAVQDDDESDEEEDDNDDDVDEWLLDSEDEDDSDGSDSESESRNTKQHSEDTESEYDGPETDSDDSSVDYQEPVTDGRKRKAASQLASKTKVQKRSEQSASGSQKPLAAGRVASSRPVRTRFQLSD